jgi:hypothetical protein
LAFAASSSTLPVAGRVLEVFPSSPGHPPLAVRMSQPPQACLSSRALAPCRTCGSSSPGIRPLRLSTDSCTSVHSRLGVAALPSASPCQGTRPVPPSRFLTALTASSARALRVCCAPLPVRGSSRFSRSSSGPEGPDACGPPRDAYSPRRILLVGSRIRITAVVALLPFCALSSPPPGSLDDRGRTRGPSSASPDARPGLPSSSNAVDHSEGPVSRSSVRVVVDPAVPPPSSVLAWSCLRARPSDAGSLVVACGPRRPPARRTLLVPAEAGAPGVATPLRSSSAFWGCSSSGRAFRGPQAGGPSFPGAVLPALSGGWVRPRPGSANSWAGDSTNALVSRGVRPA